MNRTSHLLLATLVALLPLGAAAEEKEKGAAAKTGKLPPIYDPYAVGEKQLRATLVPAEQSNRRVLVNLGTNDCAPCRVVNDAMTESKFQSALLLQFLPVNIDVSPGSKNLALLKTWEIDPKKGLPTIVILDQNGHFVSAAREGELAREAAKGVKAVQAYLLTFFEKTD